MSETRRNERVLRVGGSRGIVVYVLCSEAVDIGVQLVTQSKTFKLVALTQPEAPIQHRQV